MTNSFFRHFSKRDGLIGFFFFLTFAKVGAQVTLEGQTNGYQGEVVVYAFKDFLSKAQYPIGETTTDESGHFQLQIDSLVAFQRIEIEYGPFNKWMYLAPSGAYQIELDSLKGRVAVTSEPADQTNSLIQEFSEAYKAFLNASRVNGKRDLDQYVEGLPQFTDQVERDFGKRGHAFFQELIRYYVQERRIEYWIRELPAKKADKKAIEAIEALPVQVGNPGFWSMLHYFHQNRLHQFVGSNQRRFSTLISVAELYKNDTLRDVSLLMAYQDALNRRTLDKAFLLDKLRALESSFDIDLSRQFARNLIERYDRFNEGDYFPDFALPTVQGDTIRLTDLLGKPVYIDLFGVWCAPCRASMKKMPPLVEQLGDEMHFLSISFHDQPDRVVEFVNEQGYDWHFAVAGFESELEAQLNQSVYPTYVLLDAKGRILDLPARKPGSYQIGDYFQYYLDLNPAD
ncbi:MAG: TlpA disulfide reductase family protein [Bacteroidota bacterium]